MLLDAILALLVMKIFGMDGLTTLGAIMAICVIRTCHNFNLILAAMEEQVIDSEEEEI